MVIMIPAISHLKSFRLLPTNREMNQKYNNLRLHQSLGNYDTPLEAYKQMQKAAA